MGIKLLGLFNYFEDIICSEDVVNSKPYPDIFNKVISITKFKKNEALIFEDSDKGIVSAQRANIDYVDIRENSFKDLLSVFKNGS